MKGNIRGEFALEIMGSGITGVSSLPNGPMVLSLGYSCSDLFQYTLYIAGLHKKGSQGRNSCRIYLDYVKEVPVALNDVESSMTL